MHRSRWFIASILLMLVLMVQIPVAAQDSSRTPDSPSAVLAPSGETITYQGLLRQAGTPANGVYDLQFSLYTALTGGTNLGVVSVDNVTVTDGVFTVQLTYSEGLFNGEERWIELAVKADAEVSYTTLTPRQQVTGAPLALALPGFWTRQNSTSPNLLGGYEGNTIDTAAVGIAISGGGTSGSINTAYDNYSTIGGGAGNSVGSNDSNRTNDVYSVIGGGLSNSTTQEYSVIGGGQTNSTTSAWATIGGGVSNSAGGRWSVIGGGTTNIIYDDYGTISGGANNIVGQTGDNTSQVYATVGGGTNNSATEDYATIAGGRANTSSDVYATIGGGYNNQVSAQYGTIGGGGSSSSSNGNRVYDNYGTIGGGTNNVAGVTGDTTSQPYATVGGGSGNTASEDYATIGGGSNNTASGTYATVAGGNTNIVTSTSGTIAGGQSNVVTGTQAFIGGGSGNVARGQYSTVGGGTGNISSNRGTTVGGGAGNTATGDISTVAGGIYNDATNTYATVVGGINNNATGGGAFIGGGQNNTAAGTLSAILGGAGNNARGEYSIAGGQGGQADHDGSFVWAGKQESKGDTIASTGPNQFIIRAPGGMWLGSSTKPEIPDGALFATEAGAFLSKGGTWSNSSDRALKDNFAALNNQAILQQLATIPILSWNYTSEGESVRHIGPTAQDFYTAFGVGSDDRHIATVDADGVALAAIQGLHSITTEQDTRIAELESRLAQLEGGAISSTSPVLLILMFALVALLSLSIGLWIGIRLRKGGTA